jgi:hypothetical protein
MQRKKKKEEGKCLDDEDWVEKLYPGISRSM